MTRTGLAACVLVGALAIAGCDRSDDSPAAVTTERFDSGSTTGTSGTADGDAAQIAEPAGADLPDTASPLALIGSLGLLSLLGAAAVRRVRRDL